MSAWLIPICSYEGAEAIERISNDPTAWSARVDIKYRISFEPSVFRENGAPAWTHPIKLLRILGHDDLYRSPH